MLRLRSVELTLPELAVASDFLTNHWGLSIAERGADAVYLRGAGESAYLLALFQSPERSARSITFSCDAEDLVALESKLRARTYPYEAVVSQDAGGGTGLQLRLPEGEVFRFLSGERHALPSDSRDRPKKLTHVVLNSADAEATARFTEEVLGFKVSDRTKGMVFVRCNRTHHSLAFAHAGYASLNHIAFEMQDLDAVMRGMGRMRDIGMPPAWGPGRHGPGNNVFAYYVAPFGAVIEYSTASDEVAEDYRVGTPEEWTWPPNRIDQWGISAKDVETLTAAEQRFRFPGAGTTV